MFYINNEDMIEFSSFFFVARATRLEPCVTCNTMYVTGTKIKNRIKFNVTIHGAHFSTSDPSNHNPKTQNQSSFFEQPIA